MHKIKQALAWLDDNGLFILSAFLIVFIPLFPKIPIFDVLPGYIVRARPEDVLILFTALIWIKDALRKKFEFNTIFLWIVILYTLSGAISIFLGTTLLQSIPAQLLHIGKSSLHLFRYLEYFALFFFTYSSIKTQKQLKIVLTLITGTILLVVLYGFGQEYFKFPLFSTMNREYSKGVTLYLQDGARPQSTFAGHYDLAAYLVIVLPLIFSLALATQNVFFTKLDTLTKQRSKYIPAILHLVHILGAWMLVTSGSKTALLAYVVGIFIVLLFHLQRLGNLKQQLKWGTLALILTAIVLTVFLNYFAQPTRDKIISLVKTQFDSQEVPANPDATPDDLIGDGVVFKQITVKNPDGTETKEWIEERSTWSPNALKYGLSMGIRLDTLWPNALKGFANNPLFGNGYSTLTVIDTPWEYSNADSTDNNYLRTLGETGIVGFIIFYGFVTVVLFELLKMKVVISPLLQAVRIGFIGSILGILINAVYIDVFAASKVAYTFWALAGVTLAALKPDTSETVRGIKKHFSKHWPIYFAIMSLLFLLHKNPFHKFAQIQDLNVTNTQIESLTTAKCYIETGSYTVCSNNGLVLKENKNLYSTLLVPFLRLYDNPMMFYVLNLSLALVGTVAIYILIPIINSKILTVPTNKLILAGSLLSYTLIGIALHITSKPLSTIDLFAYLVFFPVLILLVTSILHRINKNGAFALQIGANLTIILMLINSQFISQFIAQYRNDQTLDKQFVLASANKHFSTQSYLNREKDFYLISSINPYYLDFFSNGNYELLPLSETQSYIDQVENVYPLVDSKSPLIDQYKKLALDVSLFATDYGAQNNSNIAQSFQSLKDNFDLTYIAVGCNDTCSLYQVKPESIKISPKPQSINSRNLELSSLRKPYSFALVSNRFEPKTEYDKEELGYSTQTFAQFLRTKLQYSNRFVIITGDVLHDNGEKNNTVFTQNFNRMPIVYNPGNFDLRPEKYHKQGDTYFYTDTEFFLFFNPSQTSEISQSQQKFIYNAFLELEKLPNIKNIFIVSHNLDWQNKENTNNFILDLERKLSQFPEQGKFIISSYHTQETDPEALRTELTAKHIIDAETNTNYLTSLVRDWENDSFFEFMIHADGTVGVEYRVRGENF